MAIQDLAIDATPVVRASAGNGQMVPEVPRIQLPDETPNLSQRRSSDHTTDFQSEGDVCEPGHFVSKDVAIDGSGHDHTTAE